MEPSLPLGGNTEDENPESVPVDKLIVARSFFLDTRGEP